MPVTNVVAAASGRVPANSPYKSIKDLVDAAKANREINFGQRNPDRRSTRGGKIRQRREIDASRYRKVRGRRWSG